jgi:diaminopimelate decarboxylase
MAFEAEILNLGGGFGVRYTKADPVVDIKDNIKKLAEVYEGKVL